MIFFMLLRCFQLVAEFAGPKKPIGGEKTTGKSNKKAILSFLEPFSQKKRCTTVFRFLTSFESTY